MNENKNDKSDLKLYLLSGRQIFTTNSEDIFLLSTHHQTILSCDLAKARLRHDELSQSNRYYLCLAVNGSLSTNDLDPLNIINIEVAEIDTKFSDIEFIINPASKKSVSISIADGFLSANKDGSVGIRQWARDWEVYKLLPLSFLSGITGWNGRWLHKASRSLLNIQRIERLIVQAFNRDGLIDFTTPPPRVDAFMPLTQDEPPALPSEISTKIGNVDIHPFNPLIYYCVYGKYEYLESLEYSLHTLDVFGKYEGSIAIITNFSERVIKRHVPSRFLENLRIYPMPEGSPWLGRYSIDLESIRAHQPIIYLDCDVVCSGPIMDFLIDIILSDKVCIATEWSQYGTPSDFPSEWPEHGNWFGKFLYTNNSHSGKLYFGNSGIIGARNVSTVRSVYSEVLSLMQSPEALLRYGDQPYLNYVLSTTKTGDFFLLDKHVQIIRDPMNISTGRPRTLIHVMDVLGKSDRTDRLSLAISNSLLLESCTQ